jgi:hypothetical protein
MLQDWRKRLLKRLKLWAEERFPITYPIRVYLRPPARMQNHLGFFTFDDDEERGVISILETQDRVGLIDTFVEEWAHARTVYLIDTEDNDEDPYHHPSFWSEYGRIQQAARQQEW